MNLVTVKFSSVHDKILFCAEENLKIEEDTVAVEVPEDAVVKRNHQKRKVKDLKKSLQAKKTWRTKGRSLKRGIAKFHRSSKGKQFHRKLGRLLATKDFKDNHNEWLISVNSLLTHLAIEEQFASSLEIEAEISLLKEEVFETLLPFVAQLVLEDVVLTESAEPLQLLNMLINYEDLGDSDVRTDES